MSDNLKVLQVFIASPNDLVEERRAIKEVADRLNAVFGEEVCLQIQLLGWEDRLPGYGRAQAQINEDVDKADLFVGFLWRRWGSDPGNPKYTSGFEEEFSRAAERREKTGSPEISLFFKDVNLKSPADLDDQLKTVLEFRETVASKKLLFSSFTDIEDWKKQTWDLLHRHLLKLLKSTLESRSKGQPQAPPPASTEESGKDAAGQKGKSSTLAAKLQVVQVWSDALEAITQGELSEFSKSTSLDKLKIARLGLASAGITNRDIEAQMPGVHLTNILFKNRKQVKLTQLEWFLILRANLVPEVGYQPGWFWLRKTTLNVKAALVFLACHDEHVAVRKAAISYARGLDHLLHSGSRGKQRPIEVLCSHSDENTRKSALEYLAEKGSAKDLPLVEKLRTDSDSDVRGQADITRNAILLRDDAAQFFESFVLTNPWVSEETLGAIQQHIATIEADLLKKALRHSDTKIQVFAAKELTARSLMTLEDIKALKDGEGVCEVLQVYYLKAIGMGQKFQPQEIRQALEPTGFEMRIFGITGVDADLVVAELFKLYTYEELSAVANSESHDAPIAYRILAEKYFDRFGEKVRADLMNDFAVLKAKSKAEEDPLSRLRHGSIWAALVPKWSPNIADYVAAGLSAFVINGENSHRELIISFLEHKSDRVRITAIKALRRVGALQDTELALRIAEVANEEVAAEAAITAMALAPGEAGSASRLLKSGKPALVRLAIVSLLGCDPKKVWPQVEERLYDEDEEIRKLICAYAIKKFPAQRLAKLLDTYLSRERYFYNVVFFLDRALYAKLPLRKLFIKELEALLGQKDR